MVGINATGVVRLAECKVPYGPRHIQVVTGDLADNFGLQDPCAWLRSAANIERLWNNPPDWLPRISGVTSLEFWICANIWFPDESSRKRAHTSVYKHVRSLCPHGLAGKLAVEIRSTRDVMVDVIGGVRRRVQDEKQGRRFGQPVLDTMRELIRYSLPVPHGGGHVGADIRQQTREELLRVLGFEDPVDERA